MNHTSSEKYSIPYAELWSIFHRSFKEDTSWDPVGRRNYGIPDRYQCSGNAFVVADIVDQSKIMWQKIGIVDPSKELAEALDRNKTRKKILKHYKNILPSGQTIDFSENQLNHRGKLSYGDEIIIDLPVDEMMQYIQNHWQKFLERYHVLKSNVISEIALLFHRTPEEIRDYLKTRKFTITF